MSEPLLRAIGVRKSYGHTEVLRGIDLAVRRGQVVCLLGPSGAGKSTFLRCLNHLETIDAGQVWVDGKPIGFDLRNGKLYELRERDVAKQRRDIGMVFQRFNLFGHRTALENVIEGPIRVLGTPLKLSDTPATIRTPPPALGQHTVGILRDDVGLSESEIEGLQRDGAVEGSSA